MVKHEEEEEEEEEEGVNMVGLVSFCCCAHNRQ